MQRARLRLCAPWLFACWALLFVAASAGAETHTTDPLDPTCGGASPCYASIQAAVDAAGPGDRVAIRPGVYEEAVVIDRLNESATGEPERIVIELAPGSPVGSAVLVPLEKTCDAPAGIEISRSRYVTIRGLTIEAGGASGIRVRGRRIDNGNIHLEHNRIFADGVSKCKNGIEVGRNNPNTVIANNVIYGNSKAGIVFKGASGGPHLVVGNTIFANQRVGVRIGSDHVVTLVNNIVFGNGVAAGSGGDHFGIRNLGSDPSAVTLIANTVCGNRLGEIVGPVLDAGDTQNFTPSGTEGPGTSAVPDCARRGDVFANPFGPDDLLGTADDDFTPVAGSASLDSGVDPRTLGFDPTLDAVFASDFLGTVRPQDDDGSGGPGFTRGAVEGAAAAADPTVIPRTLYVSSSDATCGGSSPCYGTIQEAIDAVTPRDTILVQPGAYVEQLEISGVNDQPFATEQDRIFLVADPLASPGAVVLDGAVDVCDVGHAVRLARSKYVTIQGFDITGAGGEAIELRSGANSNHSVFILRNRIYGNAPSGQCDGGIQLGRNDVSDPDTLDNPNTVIANNLIYGNGRFGIRLARQTGGPYVIVGNTIVDNGYSGIRSGESHLITVVNNVIFGNGSAAGGASAFGIRRASASPPEPEQVTLIANLICGNAAGPFNDPGLVLDPTDFDNLTASGSEGDGVVASPGCDVAANLFADRAGADGIVGTADDAFDLAQGSPAVEAGEDARLIGLPSSFDPAVTADYSRELARPVDADGDGIAFFDIGALERGANEPPNEDPPAIAITQPADGAIFGAQPVTVSGTIANSNDVEVNAIAATVDLGTFTADVPLVEGENVVTALGVNDFGTDTDQITIYLDTTGPAIVIESPLDGISTTATSLSVSGTVTDASPIAAVDVNGVAATVSGGSFAATVPLSNGANALQVTATDALGNASLASVTVFRGDAPTIAIDSPVDGALFSASPVAVSGTLAGTPPFLVEVNGAAGTVTGTSYTGAAALVEGANVITASVVTDFGGDSAQVTVTLDTIAPIVAIQSPPDGAVVSAATISVSGTVSDASPVSGVTVNGVPASLVGSSFSVDVPLVEGANPITAEATDAAGNVGSAAIVVTRDSTAPVVTIDSPTDGLLLSAATVTVSGSVSDASAITGVAVNGVAASLVGSTFTADVALVEGANAITAQATDAAGNVGSAAISVTRDATAPTLTIDSPSDGALTSAASVTVSGTATDANGVSALTLNGVSVALAGDAFSADVPLAEGANAITAEATDAAGNVATVAISVTRDSTPPSITIDSLVFVTSGATITVTGNFADPSGVLTVTVNGVPATLTGNTFSAEIPLVEGDNPIVVEVTDAAGNVGSAPTSVTRDSTPPEVVLSGDGILTSAASVTVNGSVTDATAITSVTVNGVAATLSGNSYSAEVPLVEGPNAITAEASDAAGNVGSTSVTVTRDSTAPVVTIDLPADGALVSTGTVSVSGTVTDASPISSVTVNGVAAAISGGSFSASVPLVEGANTLTATATDAVGNVGSAETTVTLDSTAPGVTIDAPPDGLVTAAASVTVSGTVSDASGIASVTVNGVVATLSGSTFSADVPLVAGANVISAEATDGAGNIATASITVTRDDAAPVVEITSPADGTQVSAASISVTGTVSDTGPIASMLVNGVVATLSGDTFDATVPLAEGANTLTAQATDSAGNTGSASVVVTRDSTAPGVTIGAPAAGFVTAAAQVDVSGTLSDASAIDTVTVNGFAATVTGATYALAGLALVEGQNSISVQATDVLGNIGSAQVSVTRDSTPPVISVDAPDDGDIVNTAALAVIGSVVDATAITQVTVDGVAVSISPKTSGALAWSSYVDRGSARSVATDAAGDVVVAGVRVPNQFAVAKLDAETGAEIWRFIDTGQTSAGAQVAHGVAVDAAGDVYAVGQVDLSWLVVKLSGSDGTELWRDVIGNSNGHLAFEVILDGAGQPIVIGTLSSMLGVVKYDAASGAKLFGPVLLSGTFGGNGRGLALDGDGNVVVVGSAHPSFVPGVPAAKLDGSTGAVIWSVVIAPPGGAAEDVEVDAAGDVFIAGNTPTPARLARALKLSGTDGALIWETVVDDASDGVFRDVELTSAGDPIFAGYLTVAQAGASPDPAAVKLDGASGGELWRFVTDAEGRNDQLYAVAVDAAGDAYVAGFLDTVANESSGLAAKLDGDSGLELWRVTTEGSGSGFGQDTDTFSEIAFDPTGRVVVAGIASEPNPGMFAVKLDEVPDGVAFERLDVPLAEGANSVTVTATDSAGNTTTDTRTVTLDTVAPVVTIDAPLDGFSTQDSTVAVTGSVSDTSPIGSATVNGVVATLTGSAFQAVVPLVEGANSIDVAAVDAAGNTGAAGISGVRDSIPPTVTIESPADGLLTSSASVSVSGTVSDASAIASVEVNGVAATLTGSSFTASVSLVEGPNTIVAEATDTAGNVGSAQISVDRDSTAPSVTIDTPADTGFVTTAASIVVSGSVSDASAIAGVTVNGIVAELSGNDFSATVPLSEGPNTLVAEATDAAGNVGSAQVSGVRDSIAPSVTIDSPADGSQTTAATLEVSGTASDANGVVGVTVNGVAATLSGNAYSATISLAEGANLVTALATDSAGNSASAQISVTRDSIAPVVTIDAPADGALTAAATQLVTGNVSDAGTVSGVTVNGVAADLTGSSFSATVPLVEGSNAITAQATDTAGNVGSAQITVTRDSTAPVVTIDAPADGSTTPSATITVSGTYSDASPVTAVTVNGVTASLSGGSFEADVPLAAGANTITAQATDAAGNVGVDSITVTRGDPPTVSIDSPASGAFLATTTVTVTGTITGTAPVAVDVNGVAATVTGSSYSAQVPLAEGANTVTATATNAYGSDVAARSVTVDTVQPSVVIDAPIDGATVTATPITASGIVIDASPVASLTLNGTPITAGASFTESVDLVPGPNTITVVATDAAGNSGSASVTVTLQVPQAVTTAIAEIAPSSVIVGQTAEAFVYTVLPTISGTDTGVDRIILTPPASFGTPLVSVMTVGGSPVSFSATPSGSDIVLDFSPKSTSSAPIQIGFTANTPASATVEVFDSSVDDSTTPAAPQATTPGDANGNSADGNSTVVSVVGCGSATFGGNLTNDTIFYEACSPYTISSTLTIRDGAVLLIEPGVEVRFAANAQMVVSTTALNGGLIAAGTPAQPIVFKSSSATPTPGIWRGLTVNRNVLPGSALSHVEIEFAGVRPALTLDRVPRADMAFADIEIRSCGNVGLNLIGGSPLVERLTVDCPAATAHGIEAELNSDFELRDSTISNAMVATYEPQSGQDVFDTTFTSYDAGLTFRLHPDRVSDILTQNTVLGITPASTIRVTDGAVLRDALWPEHVYRTEGDIDVRSTNAPVLTIEAGAELRFGALDQLSISNSPSVSVGGLVAVGTPTKPILFTSDAPTPAPGDWRGVDLLDGLVTGSHLENVIIEYTNGPALNLVRTQASDLTLRNGEIRNCDGVAIRIDNGDPVIDTWTLDCAPGGAFSVTSTNGADYTLNDSTITNGIELLDANAQVSVSGNTFSDYDGGTPFRLFPDAIVPMLADNLVQGLTPKTSVIEVVAGTLSTSTTWSAFTYRVLGQLLVQDSVNQPVLTLRAGTTLRFAADQQMLVGFGAPGGLVVDGSEAEPVVFTSDSATPAAGDWVGLRLAAGTLASSRLDWPVIEYSGSSTFAAIEIRSVDVRVAHAVIRDNAKDGISVREASPLITHSTIEASGGDGIDCAVVGQQGGQRVRIWDNQIIDNAASGVRCKLGADIARNAISGSATGIELTVVDPVTRIRSNNLVGNVTAIANGDAAAGVDARLNWFGSTDNPAPQLAGFVLANPWLGEAFTGPFEVRQGGLTPPVFVPVQAAATLEAQFSTDADWSLDVRDVGQAVVRSFSGSGPGVSQAWLGDDGTGTPVVDGSYRLSLSLQEVGTGSPLGTVIGEVAVDAAQLTAKIGSPAALEVVEAEPISVVGSVGGPNFASYVLEIAFGADAQSGFTTLQTGTVPVASGPLGVWDATSLEGGAYTLRLTVSGTGGELTVDRSTVQLLTMGAPGSPVYLSPNGDAVKDTAAIVAGASADTDWAVVFRDPSSQIVRTIEGFGRDVVAVWDGLDDLGGLEPDAPYTVEVIATDAFSGASAASAGVAVVDTTAPTALIDAPTTGASILDYAAIDISGTADDLNFADFSVGYALGASPTGFAGVGGASAPVLADVLATIPADAGATPALASGDLTLRLLVNDLAGNQSVLDRLIAIDRIEITNVGSSPTTIDPYASEVAFVSYELNRSADVTIEFYREGSAGAGLVATRVDGASRSGGTHAEVWDGRDNQGQAVSRDGYYFSIVASDGAGRSVRWNDPAAPLMGPSPVLYTPLGYFFNGSNDLAGQVVDPYRNDVLEIEFSLRDPGKTRVVIRPNQAQTIHPLAFEIAPAVPQAAGVPRRLIWDGRRPDGTFFDQPFGVTLDIPDPVAQPLIFVSPPVLELENARTNPYVFHPTLAGTTNVSYTLARTAQVEIDVIDPNGNFLLNLLPPTIQVPGTHETTWDGRVSDLIVTLEGSYTLEVRALDVETGETVTRRVSTLVYR